MLLTVVNPLLFANMVCMSDSALVFRSTLNQPSMFLSVYLNATGAFYQDCVFFVQNIVLVWNVWYRYVVYSKQQ